MHRWRSGHRTRTGKSLTATVHRPVLRGVLFVCLSAVGFSAKAIFARLAYREGIDAVSLLTLRMVFALPFFLIIGLYVEWRARQRLAGKTYFFIFLLGLLGYYLASLFDFMGLQYVPANLERLILFIYPTIVLLLGWIFFEEKIGALKGLSVLLTYAGIGISFYADFQASGPDVVKGSLLVFASAIVYSLYLVGSGRLIGHLGSLRFTALAMSVSSVAVYVHYAVQSAWLPEATGPGSLRDFSSQIYLLAVGMALLSTVIPALLLSEGVRLIGSGPAAIAATVGPVSILFMAHFILDEPIGLGQIAGAALVLIGVSLLGKRS